MLRRDLPLEHHAAHAAVRVERANARLGANAQASRRCRSGARVGALDVHERAEGGPLLSIFVARRGGRCERFGRAAFQPSAATDAGHDAGGEAEDVVSLTESLSVADQVVRLHWISTRC